MSKDFYIKKISELSDRYGDKLLLLMDKYNVDNLSTITAEDAKEFYEQITPECPAVAGVGNKQEVNNWCEQSKYIPKAEQEQHCLTCLIHARRQEEDKMYEINNNNERRK